MARKVTRGAIKLRARQLADVENDPNITDAELNGLFDLHVGAYWDILASAGYADYNSTTVQLTTVAGQIAYPLATYAPDLLSLTAVFTIEAADIRRPIDPFTERERGLYRAPQAAWPIEFEYIPCAPVLTDDGQDIDGVDGWDLLVSSLMARDILQKRQQEAGLVLAMIAGAEMRIKTYASKRIRGGPKYLPNVEATGMIFPPTVRVNGWRLRGGNLELYEMTAIGWPV